MGTERLARNCCLYDVFVFYANIDLHMECARLLGLKHIYNVRM